MKYQFMDEYKDKHSIRQMCQILAVSRSGYYAWKDRQPSQHQRDDQQIGSQIQQIFASNYRCYGSPRIQSALRDEGIFIGTKRISRLMKQLGCQIKPKSAWKPYTTQTNPHHPIQPNVLQRDFQADRPYQKWMSDITYIRTQDGFVYLAAVMDLFSRKIVGMALARHMEASLVEQAFQMAWQQENPKWVDLHHSDRGAQYTAQSYQELLHGKVGTISMSRKGNCWDGAPIESFWDSLKAEAIDQVFESYEHARSVIFAYVMGFYNTRRKHSTLGYLSPLQFEQRFWRDSYCPK